ncbi:hypothetical protein H0H93_000110 [Arthromyces matolae]|nr:hypothetical protein H0H93_000110 [Arthromyces matolae]
MPLLVLGAPPLLFDNDDSQVEFSMKSPSRQPKTVHVRPVPTSEPRPLVMAYFPDWVGDNFRPEDISCLFDWVDFAFALPTKNMDLSWDEPDTAPDKLTRLISRAHECGSKAKLSIGGWTGSQLFSSAVRTSTSRSLFAKNILKVYKKFGLDGIDLDWEYPGHEGAQGNVFRPEDSHNFLLFLKTLRSVLPLGTCITAAAQTVPFMDENGNPMKDLKPFATFLNWTMLMNYDDFDSSTEPGPNAPMYDGCHNSTQPDYNAAAGVQLWMDAGFPSSQLVLGVPTYGYLSTSSANGLRQRRRSRSTRFRKDTASSQVKLVAEDNAVQGQIMFREIVKQGGLSRTDAVDNTQAASFKGAGGFTRYWDTCSATPYLRSRSAQQIVSYDDPDSLSMKGQFVACTKMHGVSMFDIHGDTENGDLVHAMKQSSFTCKK